MKTKQFYLIGVISVLLMLPNLFAQQGFNTTVCPFSPGIQEETSITVDPQNANHLVGSSMYFWRPQSAAVAAMACYYSTDAGTTWNYDTLPGNGNFDRSFNGSVAFDGNGKLYCAYGAQDRDGDGNRLDNGIFVNVSGDGGGTWRQTPFTVLANGDGSGTSPRQVIEDKPWIACDQNPHSQFFKSVYVAWYHSHVDAQGNPLEENIYCSHWDFQQSKFLDPVVVSDTHLDGVNGAMPAVGPNGWLYVAWLHHTVVNQAYYGTIYIDKSTDGGGSFTNNDVPISSNFLEADYVTSNRVYASSDPSLAIDNSGGPYNGYMYVVWADKRSQTTQVYLSISPGLGANWGAPILVSNLPGEQWSPSVTVSPNGDIFVAYYVSYGGGTNVYVTSFLKGGSVVGFRDQPMNQTQFVAGAGYPTQDFMGDYFSVAASKTCIYPFWTQCQSAPNADQTVVLGGLEYSIPTTINQLLSTNGNVSGTSGQWDGTSFSNIRIASGGTAQFLVGNTEAIQANQAIDPTGQKYHDWNRDLSNLKNHHEFKQIDFTPSPKTAYFLPTQDGVTLNNVFLDAPSLAFFDAQFSDPWLIDYPDSTYGNAVRNRGIDAAAEPVYPASNNLGTASSHQGTFPNQSGPLNNWLPPFYSVTAPSTSNNFQVIFQKWTSSSGTAQFEYPLSTSTPVMFQTTPEVITANCKAHLGTGSTSALSNNGQRKFVRDQLGNYHCVYESAGKIFYFSGAAGGTTWYNEAYLSGDVDVSGYTSRNPVIDTYKNPSDNNYYPIVVWEVRLPDNSGYYLVARRMSSSGWGATEAFDESVITLSTDGTPTLAYPNVVYRKSGGPYISQAGSLPGSSWTSYGKVTNTTSSSKSPSALYDRRSGGTNLTHLVWEDNSSIYYANMNTSFTWSSRELVASVDDMITNTSPCLAMDNAGYVWIAWEYHDSEAQAYSVRARKRLGSNSYGAISAFGSGLHVQHLRPSIAGNYVKNANLSMLWYSGSNQINKVSYISGAWGSTSTLASSGQTPQLVLNEGGVSFSSKIGYFRGTTGTIYPINQVSFSEGGGGMQKTDGSDIASQSTRGIVVHIGRFGYRVEFGGTDLKNASTGEQTIGLVSLPDTIPIDSYSSILPYLQTQSFLVGNGSSLLLHLDAYPLSDTLSIGLGNIGFRLDFVDKSTNSVFYSANISKITDAKAVHQLNLYKLGMTGGKEIFLRLSVVPSANLDASYDLENIYSGVDSSSTLEKVYDMLNVVPINLLPTEYALEQNYPNPFNPTTTINYSIPKDGQVTIQVFDVLGREVETVVDAYKSAGKYSVRFDATRLSSGVYFYSIRSGDFKAVKKMVVMK